MEPKMRDAGENPDVIILRPKEGTISGAKVEMKNPDGMAYPPLGNARNAINPHVTKTPNTPKIDTGASAANDDKLQSGSNVQAVVAKMDA
mmetsp:Transcript_26112/g.36814  ORF Transcript_26112/g.36814 Transcript_26112/m.36814 type:complete len:90 (+) Transcript_26112:334-603(+)